MAELMVEAKVPCRTPNPDKPGVTNIPEWRFDLVRGAIRDVLKAGELAFADLSDAVRQRLTARDLEQLGSVGWNVTTVKLELEVRGEVTRSAGSGPQRLKWTGE